MSNITIRKKFNPTTVSMKYFELVALLNDIKLTKGELELLGYIANFGYPKTRQQKQDYFQRCKRSEPTLNNLVRFLKKKHFLFKRDGNILIHPSLKLNTEEELTLTIILSHDGE